MKRLYEHILKQKQNKKKLFAVLIDPDKFNPAVVEEANISKVDFLFVGGSKLKKNEFQKCISRIKQLTKGPLIIFPGNHEQISEKADALLLLSLLSGRNPDYLIGEHIKAAHQLKKSKLEILPTGYLLIGGGKNISTQKITNTKPIPYSDVKLAVSTAIAAELLGMKLIYLEAGSGTKKGVSREMIRAIRNNVSLPVIVGGGIDGPEKAESAWNAGADLIVVGNAIEKDSSLIKQIS
ncbi:MAG TPA: geranylgeranylglyceryl/heptaprenylglyceryl phosphate synthase, partial [Bacteroidia bacterium]|nr:geranylgeranylglyceryl/heptaprenylglyceryl phosphate synthase [Bacteroidia bacterium]